LISQIELLLIELEPKRQLLINQYDLFGLLNINSIISYEKLSVPIIEGYLNYNCLEWVVSDIDIHIENTSNI